MSEDTLEEITLIKSIKYYSNWKAKETLEKTKKICDRQKQKLISEFVNDLKLEKEWLKADNYEETALIEQHIKKWEEKLK